MLHVSLPHAKTDERVVHRAVDTLKKLLDGGDVAIGKGSSKEHTLKIHVHNSQTNIRGTDGSIVRAFAEAAAAAIDQGLLPYNTTLQFTFSSAANRVSKFDNDYAQKISQGFFPSKLDEMALKKDKDHVADYHNQKPLEVINPDLVIVMGAEPENDNNPTDILNDCRAREMRKIIHWAEERDIPTLASCRAAHVGLFDTLEQSNLSFDQPIERLDKKLKTIAPVSIETPPHDIVKGLGNTVGIHVTRLCAFNQTALNALSDAGIVKRIAHSEEAGTLIAAKGNTFYISGHTESTPEDPGLEDDRDVARGNERLGKTQNYDRNDNNPLWIEQGRVINSNLLQIAFERKAALQAEANLFAGNGQVQEIIYLSPGMRY